MAVDAAAHDFHAGQQLSGLLRMTHLTPAVIWGARGHAKVLGEFLGRVGYEIVALFDNDPSVTTPLPGVPLYFGEEGFLRWRAEFISDAVGLVAIGGARGQDRLDIQKFFSQHRIDPITVIHPTAFVAANAILGSGVQVLAQAAVATDARIGTACIVNTSASVDHECVLADGVHIAPRAVLAGCVDIGACTLIGVGAVILPNIRIGRNAIIGAGAVVTRDVPDDVVVYGNPARIIKSTDFS